MICYNRKTGRTRAGLFSGTLKIGKMQLIQYQAERETPEF